MLERRIVATMCALAVLAGCGRGAEAPAKDAADAPGAAADAAGGAASGAAGASGGPGGAPGGANAVSGEARARAVRAAADAWPKVEGTWRHGQADSTYVAYFDGGELRYLVEESAARGAAAARSQYWFDGDALWYYSADQAAQYGGEGPGALPATVPVVAEFRGQEVVRAVVREHYGEKKLDEAAVSAIRRRAAELAGAARDEWSAREAK